MLLAAAGPLAVAAAGRDIPGEILGMAIAAYKAGNMEPAIGGINAALRAGLSDAQTARALYYRGLAYRKHGQPGHAISDLTRALDAGGLSDAERSDAMEARSAAYQEAGIADQETVVVTAPRGEAPAAPPAPIETAALPGRTAAPVPGSTDAPSAAEPPAKWDAGTQIQVAAVLPVPGPKPAVPAPPAPAIKPTASKDVAPRPLSAPAAAAPNIQTAAPPAATWSSAEVVAAPGAATAPQAKQAQPAKRDAAAGSARGPATASAAKKAAAAVSTEPLAPFITKVAAVTPAVAAMPPPAAVPTVLPAAVPVAPATPAPGPTSAADIRVLVGETRSRSEAFALAIRLTSQRGAGLGPRKPQIAAGTMADMVVYRVRLGPFADGREAQAVCQSLRASGYPCILE